MSWDTLYLLLNAAVVPAWGLLLFMPRAALTRKLVHSGIYPIGIGLFYLLCFLAAAFLGQAAEGFSFFTLDGVATLFDHPNGVLIGWSHYLAFDLFVGAWIGRDAARRNYPHLIVAPMMLFTYLYGPFGLLAYMVFRFWKERQVPLLEE